MARKSLGPFATQQQVDLLTAKLKANDPLIVRYGRWLGVLVGVIPDPLQDPGTGPQLQRPARRAIFRQFRLFDAQQAAGQRCDLGPARQYRDPRRAGLPADRAAVDHLRHPVGPAEGGALDRTLSVVCITFTSIPEFASGVFLVTLFVILWPVLPGTSPLNSDGGWAVAFAIRAARAVLVHLRFRLCRAHDPRLDDRRHGAALYPHRRAQGHEHTPRGPRPCPAQCDDRAVHGAAAADQLPDQRRRRHRAGLCLSGLRPPDARRQPVRRYRNARGGNADHRRRSPSSRSCSATSATCCSIHASG